jgi:hypothetical protein
MPTKHVNPEGIAQHGDFVQASKLNRLNIFARIWLVIYPKRIGHL